MPGTVLPLLPTCYLVHNNPNGSCHQCGRDSLRHPKWLPRVSGTVDGSRKGGQRKPLSRCALRANFGQPHQAGSKRAPGSLSSHLCLQLQECPWSPWKSSVPIFLRSCCIPWRPWLLVEGPQRCSNWLLPTMRGKRYTGAHFGEGCSIEWGLRPSRSSGENWMG